MVKKLPTGIEGFDDVCRGDCLYLEVHSLVVHQGLENCFFSAISTPWNL